MFSIFSVLCVSFLFFTFAVSFFCQSFFVLSCLFRLVFFVVVILAFLISLLSLLLLLAISPSPRSFLFFIFFLLFLFLRCSVF